MRRLKPRNVGTGSKTPIKPEKTFGDVACLHSDRLDRQILKKTLQFFPRGLVLWIIGTISLLFGAVEPWVWSFYGLLMIVAYLGALWHPLNAISWSPDHAQNGWLYLFFIWSLMLCLPLPYPLLALISPVQAGMLAQAASLTDSSPGWHSLGYGSTGALSRWIFLLSLGLFYAVVRHLCNDRQSLKRIVLVMIGIGVLQAVYGLLQTLVPSMGVLWIDHIEGSRAMARGTFINRNHLAGQIEMIWPLALGVAFFLTARAGNLKQALASERLNRQALVTTAIIVLLLALVFTRSRAGITGAVLGFAVFVIMARPALQKHARKIRVVLAAMALLVVVYAGAIGIEPVSARFLSIGEDGGARPQIWKDSLRIVKDHPLGIGLGNFARVYSIYQRSLITDKTVEHAHNDYLQLLAETGWIAFVALLAAFLTFMLKSAQRIRSLDFQSDPLVFFLAVGAFSALVAIAFHSLFDFNLQIPANCLYAVVLVALLGACTAPARKRRGAKR
jgi:O-antigen ligase